MDIRRFIEDGAYATSKAYIEGDLTPWMSVLYEADQMTRLEIIATVRSVLKSEVRYWQEVLGGWDVGQYEVKPRWEAAFAFFLWFILRASCKFPHNYRRVARKPQWLRVALGLEFSDIERYEDEDEYSLSGWTDFLPPTWAASLPSLTLPYGKTYYEVRLHNFAPVVVYDVRVVIVAAVLAASASTASRLGVSNSNKLGKTQLYELKDFLSRATDLL